MEKEPFLSVIIPAYNEAARLPRTLIEIDAHLTHAPYEYELILVNDGSTDGTGNIARSLSKLVQGLTVIDLPSRQGKGAAVKVGMLAACGKYRLYLDADHAVHISVFDELVLPCLKEDKDLIVCGAWREAHERHKATKATSLVHRSARFVIRAFVVPEHHDTQCGFKCFSAQAAEDIFSRLTLTEWAFDVEVLLLAERLGYAPREVFVPCRNHTFSYVTPSALVKVAFDALKVRRFLGRNGYKLDKKWDTRL